MRHAIKALRGLKARATDGLFGKVSDVWFDDRAWKVRYVVLEIARWLPSRRVLVPADLVDAPDNVGSVLPIRLTKDQIAHLPEANERELPNAPAPISTNMFPVPLDNGADKHLVGARELLGYGLCAESNPVGHVEDIFIDCDSWRISAVVSDIGHRRMHRLVLIEPAWIDKIDWLAATVRVAGPVQRIYAAPELETTRAA
jgi:hypothetical protein